MSNKGLYDSDRYRRDARQAYGDTKWTLWKIIVPIFIILVVVGTLLYGLGIIGQTAQDAVDVAHQEFGPKALLQKYEWFKDQSAALDKKQADIKVYQGRITAMDANYKGTARKDWPRDDREQYNVWQSEVAGVKASYNTLAAEYNAQMAKFNWHFANRGDLPRGAENPLPRDYKPYTEQ